MTDRELLDRIIRAWVVEGPAPGVHRRIKSWVIRHWPALAKAIQAAVESRHTN